MSQTEYRRQRAPAQQEIKPDAVGGAWFFRREVIGLALSAAALLSAVAVGAETNDSGEQPPMDEKSAGSLVTTSANLMQQINQMFDKATKAASDTSGSTSAKTRECVGDVYQEMKNSHKLAQQYAVDVELSGKMDLKIQANAAAVERAYAKLSSVYEAFVSLDSRLNGCGGSQGGTAIDGAPTVTKSNGNVVSTTNATATNSSTMTDMQVSAENSKSGSPTSLGEQAGNTP